MDLNQIFKEEFNQMRNEKEAPDIAILTAAEWVRVSETPFASFWRPANQPEMQGVRCDIARMMVEQNTFDMGEAVRKHLGLEFR